LPPGLAELHSVRISSSLSLHLRQFEAPDLLPYFTREEAEQLGLDGYKIDTFSSDYDDFVDEFGTEFEAHGA
jgi:hypothetical protein